MNKFLLFLIIISVFLIVLPVLAQTVVIPNPLEGDGDIPSVIHAITGLLKVIVIPLGIIMIIIGGIQYMTSAGNEEKTNKAKKTILWAIIGIAIIISADFIAGFIKEILGG